MRYSLEKKANELEAISTGKFNRLVDYIRLAAKGIVVGTAVIAGVAISNVRGQDFYPARIIIGDAQEYRGEKAVFNVGIEFSEDVQLENGAYAISTYFRNDLLAKNLGQIDMENHDDTANCYMNPNLENWGSSSIDKNPFHYHYFRVDFPGSFDIYESGIHASIRNIPSGTNLLIESQSLFHCEVEIPKEAELGSYETFCLDIPNLFDPENAGTGSKIYFPGQSPSDYCSPGEIRVLEEKTSTPTPTSTSIPHSTSTPTKTQTYSPTNTRTNTITPTFIQTNTPTPTYTITPTPSKKFDLIGDCNNDGIVKLDELITGINILLGRGDLLECPEFDRDNNGKISIDELVNGVSSALTKR